MSPDWVIQVYYQDTREGWCSFIKKTSHSSCLDSSYLGLPWAFGSCHSILVVRQLQQTRSTNRTVRFVPLPLWLPMYIFIVPIPCRKLTPLTLHICTWFYKWCVCVSVVRVQILLLVVLKLETCMQWKLHKLQTRENAFVLQEECENLPKMTLKDMNRKHTAEKQTALT